MAVASALSMFRDVRTGIGDRFRSFREPTMAGYLRRLVLIFLPVPLTLILPLAVAVGATWSAPGWLILLSGSVSVAVLLMCLLIQPPPLPAGLSVRASVRRSLHRYQQITRLRIALPLAALAMGAAAALVGDGLLPYLAALVLAWPQLLLALPGAYSVSRARHSMEAWGAQAQLWTALAEPAPGIRPGMRRFRSSTAVGWADPVPGAASSSSGGSGTRSHLARGPMRRAGNSARTGTGSTRRPATTRVVRAPARQRIAPGE